jgi:hypothetical protein
MDVLAAWLHGVEVQAALVMAGLRPLLPACCATFPSLGLLGCCSAVLNRTARLRSTARTWQLS